MFNNFLLGFTGKKVISRSVPTLKCVPMVPDVERRFYRIVRRRKDNEDAADDVMEGFMGNSLAIYTLKA